MKNKILFIIAIILIVVAVIFFILSQKQGQPTEAESIKIGAIIPLTGAASYVGQQNQIGLSLAVDEINKKGGIRGEKIEIIYEDSMTNPAEGVKAFNKLVDYDNVEIIISSLSAVSMAIAPAAEDRQVPVYGIMTTAKDFVQNEWTFRYQPMTDLEIAPIVEMVDELNLNDVGVIYSNDELGDSTFNTFKVVMEEKGKKVYSENFDTKEADFNSHVTKLIAKDIDSIYIVGLDSHIVNIVKTLEKVNYSGTILSLSPLSLPATREKISDFNKKIYVAAPPIYFGQLNEQAINLKESLQLKNVELNHYNALSYDVIKLIYKELDECNKIYSIEIKECFEKNISYSGVFGDLMISNDGHEIGYKFLPAVIEKGNITLF